MNLDQISPEGDLPPNHPLVLEALKGIISGPISELRTKVDSLITNPSSTLRKGEINYNNILPNGIHGMNSPSNLDSTSQVTNNFLNQIAPVHYQGHVPQQPVIHNIVEQPVVQNFTQQHKVSTKVQIPQNDSNQLELPLFKQPEVSDLHKKLFDIESKLDIILKHVKNNKN
jgi:hypothetical protein